MSETRTSLTLTEKPTERVNQEATNGSGHWTIMYQTEEHLEDRQAMIPHFRSIEIGWELDLNNYEAVATLDWSAYPEGVSPFGLAQNGFNTESWSRAALTGDIEGVILNKPLEVDDNGREWGHRSMMSGDLVFNHETGQAFVCAAQGWMRFNA